MTLDIVQEDWIMIVHCIFSIRKLCIKVTIFGFSDKKFGWFKTLTQNPFHFGNSWILRFSKVFFKEVKAEEMMMHHRLWIGFRTLKIACGFLTMLRCLEVQMTRITTRGDEKNQQSNYYFKISNNRTYWKTPFHMTCKEGQFDVDELVSKLLVSIWLLNM